MAKKRNRITAEMSKTIADSSPLIKKTKVISFDEDNTYQTLEINLTHLRTNPYQPRIDINLYSLNELISSIEQNGLLQPIVITNSEEEGVYTIVAGHRRYEAFKIMGKEKIQTTFIKNLKDKDLAIMSLTENLMRENLHPIENAIAIKNILDNDIVESQNKLAEYVGLSKGYVSKLMNILKLPTTIIQIIKDENYKDINILVLINKLPNEESMISTYYVIKELSRLEAEKYIKNKFFNINNKPTSIINIKNSSTKISVNIDIKKLSDVQIKLLNSKIEMLHQEITNISTDWIT